MKILSNVNPKVIGILASLGSAFTWVFGAIFLSNIYKIEEVNMVDSASLPFAVSFLYGAAGALSILIFLFFTGKLPELKRSLQAKSSRILWLGGSFGGPIAMVMFSIALKNLDPAYVMPVTSSYPVLCGLLAMLFLKEKINMRGWIGILVVIFGAVLVGLQPPTSQSSQTFYQGVIFALGVAVAWSLEGVFTSKGVDFFDPYIAATFRFLSYLIICPLFILPIFGGFEFIPFLLKHAFLLILLAGFFSFVNCVLYYVGITFIGSARAAAITSSYSLFSILAGFALGAVEISLLLILGGLILFAGVLVIVTSSSDSSFREESKTEEDIKEVQTLPLSDKLPLKAAIVITLVNNSGKNIDEIADILSKTYVNDKTVSKQNILNQLNAMKMAGIVEVSLEDAKNPLFFMTNSGAHKIASFS